MFLVNLLLYEIIFESYILLCDQGGSLSLSDKLFMGLQIYTRGTIIISCQDIKFILDMLIEVSLPKCLSVIGMPGSGI